MHIAIAQSQWQCPGSTGMEQSPPSKQPALLLVAGTPEAACLASQCEAKDTAGGSWEMAAVSEEEPDHGIQLSSFTALLTSRRIPKVGHWNMCAGQLRVHATREAMQPAPSVKLAARRVSALGETATSSSLGGVAPQRGQAGHARARPQTGFKLSR